jgi:hypothetical protein
VFTINGNLIVHGSQSSIESTNTAIFDNIITLNAGLSATDVPVLNAGVEVDRGIEANVAIRWNEAMDKWELSNDGTHYAIISTQASGNNYLTQLIEDLNPTLGANLQTAGLSITNTTNVIIAPGVNTQVDSPVQLKEVTTPPDAVFGYGLLFAGVPAAGKAGVYVTNSAVTNQELITRAQSIIYSLIF